MEEAAINLEGYDFVLPEEAIALRPASPRDAARLLVVRPDASPLLAEAFVADLQSSLRPGDCLVLNDTKVIPAALSAIRERQGANATSVPVSLTMIEPLQ